MEEGKEMVLVVCKEECDAAPIFDINTGQEIPYKHDCLAPPSGIAYVSGRLLAASRSDQNQPIFGGAIHFWVPNKLQESHKSYLGEAVRPIACSKDGMYLVGGAHSGNAYIWEVASGALLKSWRAHKNAISCLSFSQDSSLVISGSEDGTVHLWCMISLFQAERLPHEAAKSYPNFCNAIEHRASITGILTILRVPCPILITSSLDGSCKVTEIMSGRLLCVLALSCPITTTAIDPLEQILICGGGDAAIYITGLYGILMQYSTLKISKDVCQVLYGHKTPISALAFNSDGMLLVSGSKDGTILIWDTTTWNVVRKLENKMGPITNLLVIPKPAISSVQTGNSFAPEIPTLEKILKPAHETAKFLQSSGFTKHGNSTLACLQSSSLLGTQILDLEGKRTPEAIEMSAGMTVDEQIKNQDLAKELGDMNLVLQLKALNVMEVRADLDGLGRGS